MQGREKLRLYDQRLERVEELATVYVSMFVYIFPHTAYEDTIFLQEKPIRIGIVCLTTTVLRSEEVQGPLLHPLLSLAPGVVVPG